jgi:phosphatase NudJ
MPRIPVQAFLFVLVVVRKDDRFLLVQESGIDRGSWYLPAGGVLPGESLIEAAVRETREEAGIDVRPVALLRMDDETRIHEGGLWMGRWRFLLRAEAVDLSQQPGPTADSLDAGWFTLQDLAGMPLRDLEVITILRAASQDCPELPIEKGYKRYG